MSTFLGQPRRFVLQLDVPKNFSLICIAPVEELCRHLSRFFTICEFETMCKSIWQVAADLWYRKGKIIDDLKQHLFYSQAMIKSRNILGKGLLCCFQHSCTFANW